MVIGRALGVETEGLRRREAFCFVRFGLNSQSDIKQIVFCLRSSFADGSLRLTVNPVYTRLQKLMPCDPVRSLRHEHDVSSRNRQSATR